MGNAGKNNSKIDDQDNGNADFPWKINGNDCKNNGNCGFPLKTNGKCL